jgi:hypothetical protein
MGPSNVWDNATSVCSEFGSGLVGMCKTDVYVMKGGKVTHDKTKCARSPFSISPHTCWTIISSALSISF